MVCKRLKIVSGNSPGIQHSLLLGPHRPDHRLGNVGGKPLVGLQVIEDSITAPEAVLLEGHEVSPGLVCCLCATSLEPVQ